MARRSRKKGKSTNLLLIGIMVCTAGGMGLMYSAFSYFSSVRRSEQVNSDFSISDYRRDGSRFATTGNVYRLRGKVESIETVGNARLVCISMKGQKNERLPLLVPQDAKLDVNLSRNKTYIFNVSCRTGVDGDGNQVKGVLIVNNVTSDK